MSEHERVSASVVKSLLKGDHFLRSTSGLEFATMNMLRERFFPKEHDSGRFKRELHFSESIFDALENGLPETREMSVVLVALYGTFVQGNLSQIFEEYQKKNGREPTEDEKVDLLTNWLEFLIQKISTSEQKLFQKSSKISVGYEIEFVDAQLQKMADLVNLLADIEFSDTKLGRMYSQMCARRMPWSPEGKAELLRVASQAMKKKLSQALEISSSLSEYVSTTETLKRLNVLRGNESRYLHWGNHLTKASEQSYENPSYINGVQEVRSVPSFSMRTQLREMSWLLQAGVASHGEVNLHTTYAGVEMSTKQPEFMEATLLSAAAGFLPSRLFEEITARTSADALDFSGFIVQEHSTKPSKNELVSVYFPYHVVRNPYELDGIKSPTREEHNPDSGVERRGLFAYSIDEIPLLYKDSLLAEATAHCVAALQTPRERQTRKDKRLAKLWLELMNFWKGRSFFSNTLEAPPSISGSSGIDVSTLTADELIAQSADISNILGLYQISALRSPEQYFVLDANKVWKCPYNFLLQELYLNSFDTEFEVFSRIVRKRVQTFIMDVREVLHA